MRGNVINIYKKLGETPLAALERLRLRDVRYAKATLSYAGRLDPMAEGVVVVLVGEENKRRDTYLSLKKEYMVDILFGFETDSFDTMGLASPFLKAPREINLDLVASHLNSLIGEHEQEYPAYSSKVVFGKPLFMWAQEGKLGLIEIPRKKIEIYACECLGIRMMSVDTLRTRISYALSTVIGNFRQEEILARWGKVLSPLHAETLPTVQVQIACSSGTYVRSIAHDLGRKLGMGGLALRIVRTKVGDARIEDSLR